MTYLSLRVQELNLGSPIGEKICLPLMLV